MILDKFADWMVEKMEDPSPQVGNTQWQLKNNPAQDRIAEQEGTHISTTVTNLTNIQAFEDIEVVNRGVNMLINACAELDYDVKGRVTPGIGRISAKKLQTLLNFGPNPYQDCLDFRKNMFTDFIFDGMSFVYFDKAHIYHVPALDTLIHPHPKTFVAGYEYKNQPFNSEEMFHFKDISATSIYRGDSRLNSSRKSASTIASQDSLQKGFFDNGATFGLILTTDNSLSERAKERTILKWLQKYNPKKGRNRPLILDNGLKPHSVSNNTFKDMDFDTSIKTNGERVLTAIGIPPILLAGGNNANIAPNLRLFYLQTVMPIVRSYTSALERYFGYDIEPVTNNISALQPELQDVASYNSTLVNGGIMTPAESRERLRLPKLDDPSLDQIRVPANIAGSAANPSQGGKPKEPEE